MTNRLNGRTALILGLDPITAGIATRFVREGATVTVIDEAAALAGVTSISGAKSIAVVDDAPEAAGQATSAALAGQGLDILVIAGGDVPPAPSWKAVRAVTPEALMDGQRETARALAVAQAAEDALLDGGGSVIFLFSPAGLYSEGGWGDRTVVHHAKRGLARALAMEWGHAQVRVNTLVPQADTPGLAAYRARNPEAVDFRISKTAMGRLGDPVEDIGGAAVFLASDDTAWLTGSMIFADGGGFLTSPVVETRIEPAS